MTGQWERIPNGDNGYDFRCTACRRYRFHNGEMIRKYKYCPNCGAKMVEQLTIGTEQTDCPWK